MAPELNKARAQGQAARDARRRGTAPAHKRERRPRAPEALAAHTQKARRAGEAQETAVPQGPLRQGRFGEAGCPTRTYWRRRRRTATSLFGTRRLVRKHNCYLSRTSGPCSRPAPKILHDYARPAAWTTCARSGPYLSKTRTRRRRACSRGTKGHVAAAAFLATNTLITVSGDSTAALWDLNRLPSSDIDQRAEVYAGHDECLSAVAKDPTSEKNFATGSPTGA